MVLGKDELRTRLSTTAAMATMPLYGSPRASAYTSLESSRWSLETIAAVKDALVLPDALRLTPSAAAVAGPTLPSTLRPLRR